MARYLSAMRVKIVALQEIRWPEDGKAQIEDYTTY